MVGTFRRNRRDVVSHRSAYLLSRDYVPVSMHNIPLPAGADEWPIVKEKPTSRHALYRRHHSHAYSSTVRRCVVADSPTPTPAARLKATGGGAEGEGAIQWARSNRTACLSLVASRLSFQRGKRRTSIRMSSPINAATALARLRLWCWMVELQTPSFRARRRSAQG